MRPHLTKMHLPLGKRGDLFGAHVRPRQRPPDELLLAPIKAALSFEPRWRSPLLLTRNGARVYHSRSSTRMARGRTRAATCNTPNLLGTKQVMTPQPTAKRARRLRTNRQDRDPQRRWIKRQAAAISPSQRAAQTKKK